MTTFKTFAAFGTFIALLLVLPSAANAVTVAQFTGGEFYYDGSNFSTASGTSTAGISPLDSITNPAPFNFVGADPMTLSITGVAKNSGWVVSGSGTTGEQLFTGGTFSLSDSSGLLLQGTIGSSAFTAPTGSITTGSLFSFDAINYSFISSSLNTGLSAPLPGSYSISMEILGGYSTPTEDTLAGISPFNANGVGTFSAVPVPPALWLFGSGLMGLVGIARRKRA